MKLGLVLLSGGLDSTTVATMAVRDGYEVSAITVEYGQTHIRELSSAEGVANALGIRHRVVDVGFFKELAWYSALTSPERFSIPSHRSPEAMSQSIPVTYVPLRNTFFITLGSALLESEALHAIEVDRVPPSTLEATVFIAANAIDYSGYPDCRPEYYEAASHAILLGSKLGVEYGIPIQIKTPIIHMSKADIVRTAVEIGAPLDLTWSCYEGGSRPCSRCDSCLLRAQGFAEAGVLDPALVERVDAKA
jgi:7-cyano-7-deazaguanine synthase